MTTDIRLCTTDADIAACLPVLAQLRPQLNGDNIVSRVREQMRLGYQLAALSDDGEVRAVAGFRFGLNLPWGRHLYVDDLVTDGAARSRGHGARLFGWLCAEARAGDCETLQLDSGVQRFGAHRFYLQQRMRIASHHFALELPRS